MSIVISQNGSEAVIRVTGAFDGEAAAKLRAIILGASPAVTTSVTVDLTQAREISDIALAAIVSARRNSAVQLRIRGLTHRHDRMLHLLAGEEGSAAE